MKEQPVNDGLFRQFLLGKVDDEERQRIETLFLTDPSTRDKILAAEQDLIEDYLDDCLTPADKERFLMHYADTPVQRRKLRIASTVQDWATREGNATTLVPATVSIWGRLRSRIRLKPVVVIPIAVTVMIAIVIAAVWVNRSWEHQKVEQELARLNAPSSMREALPQMESIELAPVSVRSLGTQNELTPRLDTRYVELRLPWIQEYYPEYEVVVRRFGDAESFAISELQSEDDGGQKVRIRLPAQILTRGRYQILLSGVAADGRVSSPQEYTLTVNK